MVDVWPGTLPQKLLRQGFSLEKQPQAIGGDNKNGLTPRRRRFSAAVQPTTGQIIITLAQMTTLLNFFDATLKGGVLPFQWTDPISGATTNMRFSGEVEFDNFHKGDLFEASLPLEIMP